MTATSSQQRDREHDAGGADSRSGRGCGRNRQQSATLPNCDGRARNKRKSNVITVRIYKRKDSKFWQALVRHDGKTQRITTRTTLEPAAEEFARLAFRHFSKLTDKSVRNAPPPAQLKRRRCARANRR